MLSTVLPLVAALSTGNKIGLVAVGAAFIVFALVSAMVLPRANPNFPGKSVGWYSALAVLFLVAMISAVLIFGKEKKEPSAAAATTAAATPTTTGSAPATTTSTAGASGGGSQGDATAGKAVFASAGCGACHTLKAAGSTGNVGPNLDQLKPSYDRVKNQVIHGGGPMPAFKGQLTDKQISDVSAFVSGSAGS